MVERTGIPIDPPFDLELGEELILTHCLTHRVVFPINLGGIGGVADRMMDRILFGGTEQRYIASLFLTNKRLVIFGGDWKNKIFHPMGMIEEISLDKILSLHVKDKMLLGNHLVIIYYDSTNTQKYIALWLQNMQKGNFSYSPKQIIEYNTKLWINKIKEVQRIYKSNIDLEKLANMKSPTPIETNQEKKMKICPYCGVKLEFPEPPKFCPYCEKQILV